MTDAQDEAVVIRRLIPVPRERVFAAWLDPASVAQWMRPGDVANTTVEIDPRAGGKFRIVMSHGRGDADHWGEYLTIEPPSLLSFTWISANTDHQPSIVTIELREVDEGTELTLTHRRLPAEKAEAHRKGWTDIVRKLSETLAAC
ncbi:MAG: SRPBCC family protein [Thermoanaerobaculia bacterium]